MAGRHVPITARSGRALMKLLAIDTATEACSVALWQDGAVLERFEVAGREHSTRLPQMVSALLAECGLRLAEIDGLICGIGPGSFAGVRIGVSYVKGLALGLDRPVIGVTSLAMLAEAVLTDRPSVTALAAIDARMGEVYFGAYRRVDGRTTAVQPEVVCPPGAIVPAGDPPHVAVGSGWQAYGPELRSRPTCDPVETDGAALPHALHALALALPDFIAGRYSVAATLVPAYLRNRVALTSVEQRAARAEAARLTR